MISICLVVTAALVGARPDPSEFRTVAVKSGTAYATALSPDGKWIAAVRPEPRSIRPFEPGHAYTLMLWNVASVAAGPPSARPEPTVSVEMRDSASAVAVSFTPAGVTK